ncbi:MAG TPA: hypothetical protein PJ991_02115 [Kiritimatiellia bacterium]|nr:hypothetical protein [Kiritimatiellia bacterium]
MNEAKTSDALLDVTSVAWNWRARQNPPAPKNQPTAKKILIQALVPSVIGLILYFFFGLRIFPYILWGIAVTFLLIGLFAPKAFLSIERGMQKFGHWVGIALSYILLVPFYFIVFSIGHFFRGLSGKDTLHLKFKKNDDTYWTDRAPLKPEHFKKQY